MSDVTVPGGNGLPPSISFDNTGVAALATTAIGQISSAINAGATIVASSGNAALPVLPAGQEGIVAASGSGIYQLTGGYIGIVIGDNVPATVVGGSADGTQIVSGGPLVATTGTG